MSSMPLEIRRWKRVEYEKLIDCGVFQGEHLELLGGLLIVGEPQSSSHIVAVQLAHEALSQALGPGWNVRPQGPIALDEDSEPEPDIAVVRGSPIDYTAAHPSRPLLVVEVALSSLAVDREYKSSLYARGGVPDYWIVNLIDRVLEVRRQPSPSAAAPFRWTYDSLEILGPADAVAPLAAPSAMIQVGRLLPPP